MTTSVDKVTFAALLKRPACLCAFGFGSGLTPFAPGTFGTLAALPVYWLMQDLSTSLYLVIIGFGFVMGIWFCQRAIDWLGEEDPGAVVWDEIIGYLFAMTFAPQGWLWIGLGFVLFRLFDIFKPWPVSLADRRVHGGFGVMLDDVIAGGYAAASLYLIQIQLLE